MRTPAVFIIFFFLITFTLSGQSLSLSDTNGVIPNNGTITVSGHPGTTLIARVFVTNISASAINVKVKKEYISVIPGTNNTFCWGNCYPDTIFYSIPVPIDAGVTDSSFMGDYHPNGIPAKSTIKYTFYNQNDTTDAVVVNVEYMAYLNGFQDIPGDVDFSGLYPNPASDFARFDYSFPAGVNKADVIIRDILGNIVKQNRITNKEGKIVINTEDLISGIYFYSVIVNENIALSKKLVIK